MFATKPWRWATLEYKVSGEEVDRPSKSAKTGFSLAIAILREILTPNWLVRGLCKRVRSFYKLSHSLNQCRHFLMPI